MRKKATKNKGGYGHCDSQRCLGRLYRIGQTDFYACLNDGCGGDLQSREFLVSHYGEEFVQDIDERSAKERTEKLTFSLETDSDQKSIEDLVRRIRLDGSFRPSQKF